ncbi:hypothetical protein REJC140_01147 [Pseudorhizobium endolithicum]|uniref:Uncharacterized protein n=1 Tax=Pseudorhizobium endolithicum TaxID=1191678 RepID=A0ABM8PQD8_9HYPH|nr:hypothetical protein REQ54_03680 [Rhizobium sp. Q54]CAD7042474.1 hypothetical protein REJC140_01147 [Pseudorhizobium endolithicum]
MASHGLAQQAEALHGLLREFRIEEKAISAAPPRAA